VSGINLDRLRDLAGHVRDAVRQLREVARLPEAEFLSDRRAVDSAKYQLIVAAEAALDICNHLAARKGARSPHDYADCMAIMAELGSATCSCTCTRTSTTGRCIGWRATIWATSRTTCTRSGGI
jgi:uncharacterized protein YutE (UPF0331/DUF86 family)